ncbi:MAG: periplasmic heavy metal sensor [Candidatus Omnitrophota bacterium]
MNTLKRVIVFLGILTLVSSVSALAQPPGEGPGGADRQRDRERMRQEFIQELNVTPEQQEKLDNQRREHQTRGKELVEKLRAKQLELRTELEKPAIDKNKVNAIVSEMKTLMGKRLDLRVEGILAMRSVLTPEQVAKMQEKRKERQMRRGRRMEGGGGFEKR